MKRTSSFVLLLFLLTGLTACHTGKEGEQEGASSSGAGLSVESAVLEQKKSPKILFEEKEYDFGKVEAGEDVEHAFSFLNKGNSPLAIHKVRTSCGCTGALVSSKEVPPGKGGEIRATFRSRGFLGPVKKSLTVETNDPENRFVRLTVKGKVLSEVTAEPRFLNWGTVNREKPPKPVKLRIRLREGQGIEIQEVRSESRSVVLNKEEENEKGAVYRVSLSETIPAGWLVGRISIRTSSEKVPEVRVPFHAFVEGGVKVSPLLLSFSPVRLGEPVSRLLTLEKTGGEDFTVKRVKATTDAILTEIRTKEEGSLVQLKVTYDPGTRTEGHITERLTIFLGNGEEEIIEVPVYGKIRQEEGESLS